MSPRAACRLDALGFADVHDYAPGKVDWLAHNLPVEGTLSTAPTAGSLLRTDAVLAPPSEPIGHIRDRLARSPYGFALVTSPDATVLGRLRAAALDGDPQRAAAEAMEPGPSTIRPHVAVADVAERMRAGNLTTVLVADPEGRLLGLVRRDDAER